MIKLSGLTKRFDTLVAVNQVSLQVGAGEVLALLGPNGAGKTTTVRMLSAILRPTAGAACIAGFDVVEAPQEVRRRVGVLTEAPGLYTRMNGYEYLDFFGEARGMNLPQRRERIQSLAEQFEMTPVLYRRLGEYSKGMAQKIALIRTLLHDPPVLLLDEPTSAMDPQSARLVRDAIKQMRATDRTIIICTHNLPEAEELADRIAIIRDGSIRAEGTAAELKLQLLGPALMEVQFAEPPRNGIITAIEPFVSVIATGERWLRYQTTEPEQVNPQVLRVLFEKGAAVMLLSEVPHSLEAVYLRVMEGGLS